MTVPTMPARRQVIACPACDDAGESDGPLLCVVCGGRGCVHSDPRQLVLPVVEWGGR